VLYKPNEFHALHANGISAPNTIVISFHSDCEELYRLTDTLLTIDALEKSVIAEILSEAHLAFTTDLGDPCYTKLEMYPDRPCGSLQLIRIGIERLLILLLRNRNASSHTTQSMALNKQNEERMLLLRVQDSITNSLSENLTAESIAAASGSSVSLLNKLFNKYTGRGIISYLRRRRIRAACEMIRESNLNFTQIAENLGFNSIHYFSRTFKQIQGMTPSQYANSIKAMSGPDRIEDDGNTEKKAIETGEQ
jgi:AraC-like DNA-binding protein